MATADRLSSGNAALSFKERMKAINDIIAKENDRADGLELQREEAHVNYINKLKHKDVLKNRIEEVRNEIVRVGKNDIETRMKVQKDIYSETYQMMKKAEERKIELEGKLDDRENRVRESEEKLKDMTLQLEYNNIETGRKTKSYNDASESAAEKEQSLRELEEGITLFENRIVDAQLRITDIEHRITQTEESMDKLREEGQEMKEYIRNLLETARTDLSYFNME